MSIKLNQEKKLVILARRIAEGGWSSIYSFVQDACPDEETLDNYLNDYGCFDEDEEDDEED